MNEFLAEYVANAITLLHLDDDSPNADVIRDEMDDQWYRLSVEDQARARVALVQAIEALDPVGHDPGDEDRCSECHEVADQLRATEDQKFLDRIETFLAEDRARLAALPEAERMETETERNAEAEATEVEYLRKRLNAFDDEGKEVRRGD